MKTLKQCFRRSMSLCCLLLATYSGLYAQCSGFPATTADADCAAGTTLTSGANINSGNNYGFCGPNSSTYNFTGINLAGGVLRICGNANISGNWNSGTIVVSCGATANFTSGLTLNSNVGIINYGTINVTGDLVFQNSNNYVYNQTAQSVINVSGNITYPQNNGQNAYLMNYGYIKVGGSFNAYEGGFTCLQNGSQMQVNNLNYILNCGGPNARFTFPTPAGSAIIRYTGTATIKAQFTTSPNIKIYQATGSSQSMPCGASSWGSAAITTNAPALTPPGAQSCTSTSTCWTVLATGISSFVATPDDGRIRLDWATQSESNTDFFEVQRSANGVNWQTIQTVGAAGFSVSRTYYHVYDQPSTAGLYYYRLILTDLGGGTTYSKIVTIDETITTRLTVYPNPGNGTAITLVGWNNADTHPISIYNNLGQRLYTGLAQNGVPTTIPRLAPGIYFILTDPGTAGQSRVSYVVY